MISISFVIQKYNRYFIKFNRFCLFVIVRIVTESMHIKVLFALLRLRNCAACSIIFAISLLLLCLNVCKFVFHFQWISFIATMERRKREEVIRAFLNKIYKLINIIFYFTFAETGVENRNSSNEIKIYRVFELSFIYVSNSLCVL